MNIFRIIVAINFLTVSVFCLTAGEIEAQRSGWNLSPNTQYHIQTDEGPERYFRFQTQNGQYRKEKRLADGTVIGTEGWLDPLGYLRIKDYIADSEGYRILRSKMLYVGKDRPIQDAVAISKKVPAQSGILAKPQRPVNPFRQPEVKELPGNSVEVNTVTPLGSTASAPLHRVQYPHQISTPSPNLYVPASISVTPSPNLYVPASISATPLPYGAREPVQGLEDGYSQPNTNYLPPYQIQNPYSPYPYFAPPSPASTPSYVFQPPYQQPNHDAHAPAQTHAQGFYQPAVPQGYQAHSQNYYSSNATQQGVASGERATAGEKRVGEFPEYDGTHTVKDGFQYYLKTHYHEEEEKPNQNEKIGSFGYIDPFGIRRVIYYKADAEHGFIHKKNNRYVGFQATPYDPQVSDRS